MSFVVSVHCRPTAAAVDVRIDPDGVATVADLRVRLAELLGLEAAALRVGPVLLDDALVVGEPPLLHGCELVVTDPSPCRRERQPSIGRAGGPGPPARSPCLGGVAAFGPVALHVVAGPDAGHRVPLRQAVTIGRAAGCDVVLRDPRLSRRHASARPGPEGMTLTDLGSTNGTAVAASESSPCPRHPARPGETVRLGSTRIALRSSGGHPVESTPDGLGRLSIRPRPRAAAKDETRTVEFPAPADPPRRTPLPWLPALLPIPVAALMAFVLGPMMLWFAVLSPATMLGAALADRVGARRRAAADARAYTAALAAARERVADELRREADRLRRVVPDPAELLEDVERRAGSLWSLAAGSPGHGVVRLGWGDPPALFQASSAGAAAWTPRHESAPVLHDLLGARATEVRGPADQVRRTMRLLVGQLLATHPPRALRLVALGLDEDWRWAPHARVVGSAAEARTALLDESLDPPGPGTPGRVCGPRRSPGGGERHDPPAAPARILVVGPGVPAAQVDAARRLGDETRTALLLGNANPTPGLAPAVLALGPGVDTLHRPGEDVVRLVADGVGAWWSTRLARALAPLRDDEPGGRSAPAHLTDLVSDLPAWTSPLDDPDAAVATLGLAHGAPWRVDLDRDGPHVLVGGTTGSGKSELLRAFLTSLALRLPPDRLSFVLVDYKGGASFGACANLPHTVGILTDLDPRLTERALTSLQAEVSRRERVLAKYGVPDRETFLSSANSDRERAALPRLVIVVDEFRALAQEQPDTLAGIVHLAAVGRSLGIHLVLATQRPGGAVSPEIRANVNLRIALRMRDRHDSTDVIDSPEAALLTSDAPGHGLARRGDGVLVPFRVLPVSTPAGRDRGFAVRFDGAETEQAGEVDSLGAIVDGIATVCRESARPLPPPVWLPPLPPALDAAGLAADAVGIVDVPAEQRREELRITPGAGHWLIVGGPRSGRTTSLRTIVEALAASHPPSRLHIHVLDGGGRELRDALAAGPRIPHLGTVTGADEPRRAARLLQRLAGRAPQDSDHAASGIGTPAPGADGPGEHPHLVLVVDRVDRIDRRDGADPFAPHPLADAVHALLQAGAGAGVTLVMTSGRSGLLGAAAEQATTRLLLPLNDPADLALAGVSRSAVPTSWGPGRALRMPDSAQVQLVLPGARAPRRASAREMAGSGTTTTIGDGGTRLPSSTSRPAATRPFVVEDLPIAVDAACLPTSSRDRILLGVHGDPVRPLAWSLPDDGPALLVLGPARSGRTAVLALVAAGALQSGRTVAWIAGGRPPPAGLLPDPVAVLRPEESERLVALRRRHPDLAVVADDATHLLDTPVQAPLLELARLLGRDDGLLAVAADPVRAVGHYRGIVPETAAAGHGILLGPDTGPGAGLLGLARQEPLPPLPGRALLVRGVAIEEIQLATARAA